MNHLVQTISWNTYLTSLFLFVIAYYTVVGARFYRGILFNFLRRLTGQEAAADGLPSVLQYREPATEAEHGDPATANHQKQQQAPGDFDRISCHLKACIAKAADEPFAPDILIRQLKKILNAQPEGALQTNRRAIKELIVNECEKTGTALLSEDEVDQWWGD